MPALFRMKSSSDAKETSGLASLGYAMLGRSAPSEAMMELADWYVAGEIEIADILRLTIERYQKCE